MTKPQRGTTEYEAAPAESSFNSHSVSPRCNRKCWNVVIEVPFSDGKAGAELS